MTSTEILLHQYRVEIIFCGVILLFSVLFTQFLFQGLPFQMALSLDDYILRETANGSSYSNLTKALLVRTSGITVSALQNGNDRPF